VLEGEDKDFQMDTVRDFKGQKEEYTSPAPVAHAIILAAWEAEIKKIKV
jgi:hypothetical protein